MTDVQMTELPNGLRIITSAMPHVQSASVGAWIGAGGRFESKTMCGVSHFVEHLLFKGTQKRSATDISQAIEGRGGYINAFTQEESTCYYCRVAYDHVGTALDVLCDMYLHPRLAPVDIDKERGVIIEEIMMYHDQPQHVVHEMLTDAMWHNHPLGRSLIGTPQTLADMNRTRIREYLAEHYVPGNTVFAVAGNIEHQRCVDMISGYVSRRQARKKPTARRVTDKVRQEGLTLQARDIEQSHVAMGIRLFGRCDERRFALRVMNAVLGENMSSRLFQVVREKHGLAYSVHSSCHLYKDTGALVIGAGLDRGQTPRALRLIVRELRRFKDKPIGRSELKRAKDYVIGQMRLGLEGTSHQMMWMGDNILAYEKFVSPDKVIERIQGVTADQVQALAAELLRPERLSTAVVAPPSVTDHETGIRRALEAL